MGNESSSPRGADIVLKRALPARGDAARAAGDASRIITRALNDLAAKQGRPPLGMPADHAAPALQHIIETDQGRLWLALDGGTPVAFGASVSRGRLSWCGGLFVLPEWQGLGLGRRLLEAALDLPPEDGGVAALSSSAANPVANRLYARHGIYPRHALLCLSGPPFAAAGPARAHAGSLDASPLTVDGVAELLPIDEVVLEADRTDDHLWFLSRNDHPGWVFRRRGRAVAYGYLGGDCTDSAATVGPIAAERSSDIEPVLAFLLGEMAASGAGTATVAVPGPNFAAQRLLWSAGFSFQNATGLICASRPFGRLDRYILAGDCLM